MCVSCSITQSGFSALKESYELVDNVEEQIQRCAKGTWRGCAMVGSREPHLNTPATQRWDPPAILLGPHNCSGMGEETWRYSTYYWESKANDAGSGLLPLNIIYTLILHRTKLHHVKRFFLRFMFPIVDECFWTWFMSFQETFYLCGQLTGHRCKTNSLQASNIKTHWPVDIWNYHTHVTHAYKHNHTYKVVSDC